MDPQVNMLSTVAFDHSRELVASMSPEQLAILYDDLASRRLPSMPLSQLTTFYKQVTQRIAESASVDQLMILADKDMTKFMLPTKVFIITEILEQILADDALDFFQLFKTMRVSKTFRDTIAGSTKLKKRLYLLPSANSLPTNLLLRHSYQLHPQLEALFNPLYKKIVARSGFDFSSANYIAGNSNYNDDRSGVPRTPFLEIAFRETWSATLPECKGQNENAAALQFNERDAGVGIVPPKAESEDKNVTCLHSRMCAFPIRVRLRLMGLGYDAFFGDGEYYVCHALEADEATLGMVYELAANARRTWRAQRAE